MKKNVFLVEESLKDFEQPDRLPKVSMRLLEKEWQRGNDDDEDDMDIEPEIEDDSDVEVDTWEKPEEEDDDDSIAATPEDISDEEIEDEVGQMEDDYKRRLDHEVDIKIDNAKTPIIFKVRDKLTKQLTGRKEMGVAMAALGNDTYVLKTNKGELKKVRISDMILESINESAGDGFTNYMFDIADTIKVEVPDWEAEFEYAGIVYDDLISWLEEDKPGFDFMSMFKNGVSAEDASQEVIDYIEALCEDEGNESNCFSSGD